MQFYAVRGKNLRRIGYEAGTLRACFAQSIYDYNGVPAEVRDKLIRSPFPDKLFAQIVKGKYPGTKIIGPEPKAKPAPVVKGDDGWLF